MNENGEDVFDKRLLSMVPGTVKFIVADVALQWVALACNIALFVVIGLFLQATLEGAADASMAIGVIAVSAVAIVVRMVCQTAAQRMGRKAASCAKCSIRQQVYDKLAALGPAYSETVATAVAVQVSVEGTEQLESYFGQYLPQLFYALLAPLTLFVALSPLSLPAAVALLVCVPLIPASIVCVQKIARRTMRNYWGSYTDLGSMFLEAIQGLTTLKIYSADARKHEEMNGAAESFRKATMRLLTMQLNSITVMDLFAFGGAAVGMIAVLWQFSCGAATFAAAFSIVFLSSEFFIPMRTLGSFFHTAMGGMAAAEKMYAILDAPLPVDGACEVDPHDARVKCRGVGYSYDGKRQVLEGVDFSAPCGSFIGVTGESGSGKSTLAGILSGANAPMRARSALAESICAISRPSRCARPSPRCLFRATCSRERFARTCCLPSPTRATRSCGGPSRSAGWRVSCANQVGSTWRLQPRERTFRAASASAWRSPGHCCTIRPSTSSTRPRAISTPKARPLSSQPRASLRAATRSS